MYILPSGEVGSDHVWVRLRTTSRGWKKKIQKPLAPPNLCYIQKMLVAVARAESVGNRQILIEVARDNEFSVSHNRCKK